MREYQPFLYPPDYELARIHQQATKPGKVNAETTRMCPCCQQQTKQALKSWYTRSIDHDFKDYGGAVVTYFWLVKLYAFISGLVLLIYSSFLIATIHRFCSQEAGCERFLGIWIITNQNLFYQMEKQHQRQPMVRILTLRTIAYVILIIGNMMSLYVSGRFKRRYPQPKDLGDFSLIFKNVNISTQQFALKLSKEHPYAEVKEMFNIKKMQPFYSLYNQKLQAYFSCLIENDDKKLKNMLQKLEVLDRKCSKQQSNYQIDSDRIIVVFKNQKHKGFVQQAYQLKGFDKAKYLIGFDYTEDSYCEQCPIPAQIIWNNIGDNQKNKIKLKILSVVYFFALIGGSYLLLFFCMKLVYDRDILAKPWNVIAANVIMTLLVPIALTFRQLMNRLSEMRRPNTQTSRTMFIVVTTVLFHFIYYIIIPTFYLRFNYEKVQDKNKILFIITNQTFNFLVVQFILAYIDFIFCQWNKRLKKVQDQDKPIGCQKILHAHMQYPRFPIQFKLIILFKTFSFIILFAFESPFIMFWCFALLVFLYITDKYAVYKHYRMEIIDNKVQFRFLKIYSVFFSSYTLLIYSITQHFQSNNIEFPAAVALTIVAIIIQIFFIKERVFEDQTILPSTLEQQQIIDSYRDRFNKFRQDVIDDKTDLQIKQYLAKSGHGSLQTEESLQKQRLT